MTASELSPATGAADLEQLYRDLHANPELSLQEHRTAALAGGELAAAGFEVTKNIGGTGVVGVLANGPGPTALVRADMDARSGARTGRRPWLVVRHADSGIPAGRGAGDRGPGHDR